MMKDLECRDFLQWCMPHLRLRWDGFRKVRKQVCKRLGCRLRELNLSGLASYKRYLEIHAEEWKNLDSLCRVTISRFYRDRGVFDTLRTEILPSLARSVLSSGGNEVRCWSAGCASGEEPYTLEILWKLCVIPLMTSDLPLRIIASDSDQTVLTRAELGCYPASSLKDLPEGFIRQAFRNPDQLYCIRKAFAENISFINQDIRTQLPDGSFHLILCRNLVCTYFHESLQREIMKKILDKLTPGGILVIGIHEFLPLKVCNVTRHSKGRCIYIKEESSP